MHEAPAERDVDNKWEGPDGLPAEHAPPEPSPEAIEAAACELMGPSEPYAKGADRERLVAEARRILKAAYAVEFGSRPALAEPKGTAEMPEVLQAIRDARAALAGSPDDKQLLDAYVAGCNAESKLNDAELSPENIRKGIAAAMRAALSGDQGAKP